MVSNGEDFRRRFSSLLSFEFRRFPSVLALSVIEAANAGSKFNPTTPKRTSVLGKVLMIVLTKETLSDILSPFDLKRLDSYANNMLDYHVILDLLPLMAELYFSDRLQISLSGVQRAVLLAIGLQRKGIEDLEKELSLPSAQVMAMFIKVIKKASTAFGEIEKAAIQKELPSQPTRENGHVDGDEEGRFEPVMEDVFDETQEAGDEVISAFREKQRELINSLDLQKYALDGTEEDWSNALGKKGKILGEGAVVAVRSEKEKKRKGESMKEVLDEYDQSKEKKKKKHRH